MSKENQPKTTNFGKRLRAKRLEQDMNMQELARQMGVTRMVIYNVETGRGGFSNKNMIKACDVLSTTPNYLFGFDDE